MQIETLKVFCDLVDTSSFSVAADRNSVTQSAVSQQIRALEKRFGVVFFERGRKNFAVTPEGRIFHETAVGILDLYEGIGERLSGASETVSGELRVGVVVSLGLYDLNDLFLAYEAAHSDLQFKIRYLTADEIYREVSDGAVDVGLVPHPVKHGGLVIEEFAHQRLALACSKGHPLASEKESLDPVKLDGIDMVGFSPDPLSRRTVDRSLRDVGASPNFIGEFNNVDTVKRAIEVSGAVAILPEVSVLGKSLTAVPLVGKEWIRPLGSVRRRTSQPTNALRQFLATLHEYGGANNVLE